MTRRINRKDIDTAAQRVGIDPESAKHNIGTVAHGHEHEIEDAVARTRRAGRPTEDRERRRRPVVR